MSIPDPTDAQADGAFGAPIEAPAAFGRLAWVIATARKGGSVRGADAQALVAQLDAVTAERDALIPLARLGLWALGELGGREAYLYGGDVQDYAEQYGVISPVDAAEPCGPGYCPCKEFSFPTTCYRDTPATVAARAIVERRGA